MSSIEALVVEQPCVGILDDGADDAEAGTMVRTDLPDQGLDALAQAKPAVVRTVVAGIGEKARDPDADHQGEAQQFGEHPGIMDVGGRGDRAQRQPIARDDDVVLGAALAPVGRVRPGQLATMLGPDAAAVDTGAEDITPDLAPLLYS